MHTRKNTRKFLEKMNKGLEEKYGSRFPEAWRMLLENYQAEKKAYDQAMLDYRVTRGDLDIRKTFLQKQRESLFGSQFPETVLEFWRKMQKNWAACDYTPHSQGEAFKSRE